MAMHQICFARTTLNHKTGRYLALALFVFGTGFAATIAVAAGDSPDAKARYQEDRVFCNSGQSYQDRATCLKEAAAALADARKGRLNDEPGPYRQNALIRCNALPADDRDACRRRVEGEGTTSGSVPAGGLLRELVVPDNK